ncbi:hypothetical protein [Paraburkholderia ribeironis]|nr:hypothetical protein [Paraburkholderia ribeironis]
MPNADANSGANQRLKKTPEKNARDGQAHFHWQQTLRLRLSEA